MPGLAHLYIGEEAVAVGVCSALRRDDYITSTHRGHGHCLAKGADVGLMFAELLGKEAGYCRGKGGSMHIADHANGNLGANAIVGGSTGIATGAAFSAKRRGPTRSPSCFFGDGALGQGLLYEVMNMASLWALPGRLRLREQPLQRVHALPRGDRRRRSSTGRGRSGSRRVEVDGQDVRAVYRRGAGARRTRAARRRARVPPLQHLPLSRPPRRRRRPRLLPLEGGGAALAAASATRSRFSAAGSFRAGPRRRRARSPRSRRRRAPRSSGASQFALDAPFPEPDEVTEDVFA